MGDMQCVNMTRGILATAQFGQHLLLLFIETVSKGKLGLQLNIFLTKFFKLAITGNLELLLLKRTK